VINKRTYRSLRDTWRHAIQYMAIELYERFLFLFLPYVRRNAYVIDDVYSFDILKKLFQNKL